MKTQDIRNMSPVEITAKVKELRGALLKLRFESAVGQLKNPLKKKEVRKDIARLLTIFKEKANAKG